MLDTLNLRWESGLKRRKSIGTALLGASFLLGSCGPDAAVAPLVPNARPTITLTGAPAPLSDVLYAVRLRWTATDADGRIAAFEYAVDPVAGGDTVWTSSSAHEITLHFESTQLPDPLPPPGQRLFARDQHTFVIRAKDNEGLNSEPAVRSFTSRTIVPSSTIIAPRPIPIPATTLPSVQIRWTGLDPDGTSGTTPSGYRYRLLTAQEIDPQNPDYVPAARLQSYFEAQAEAGFEGWLSAPPESTSVDYDGLAVGRTYVFAVSAWDEAGATEARFVSSSNVLQFRPAVNTTGPRLTVFNSYFSRTLTGGVSLHPSRIIPLEVPSGEAIVLHWSAEPRTGATVGGYRWAFDIPGGDIADETPRTDDSDLAHWSSWSVNETSITLGPFAGAPGPGEQHRLYVMARDNLGFATLFILELRVIAPDRQRTLLVVDDRYGSFAGLSGPYPTEAEEDSFHFAVGGVPDRLTGGTSIAGAFAGLDYDTLDYRSSRTISGTAAGIPLSILGRYQVVAWFTDYNSGQAGANGSLTPPPTALRFINSPSQLNTLVVFLSQGGKLLLFGDGAPNAIANGYYEPYGRFGPQLPYGPGNVLRPGSFLHDFVGLRSTLSSGGQTSEQLRGAIPYLPEFAGPATPTDRSHDPRIGPSAARTALRWSGLPQLTLGSYRGVPSDPLLRVIPRSWTISSPLEVVAGSGAAQESILDTLYLHQARDLNLAGLTADGRPAAVHFRTPAGGEVVWLGFPLYYFEQAQARGLLHRVLTGFGHEPIHGTYATARAPGAGAARIDAQSR